MRFTKLFPSVRFIIRRQNFGNAIRTCHSASGETVKKGLCVCVYEDNKQLELTQCGQEVDQKSGGKISQQLNALASELKLGKSFAITEILDYSAVAITCVGPRAAGYDALESLDESRENLRWGVGSGVKLLRERGCMSIEVDPCHAPDAAAEAAELAAWGFDMFKTEECKPSCNVFAYNAQEQEVSRLWCEGSTRGRAQNWARTLSDMPANKMTPVDLAQAALDRLCHLGVHVEAYDREWIEAQRMAAFLAVAKGSCDTPMFLECDYKGAGPNLPTVLLAAKGVTFDSGGLCLKETHSMIENRGSMAGAAVVLAAFEIIAKLQLPINVAGVIPICENMVSGQCMKVGDVVTALNGLSIQIENTDMEGRLMMADALVYGQSVYKPSLVVDVATFTHGVLMATGGGAFGCFSNSEEAWHAVQCAGALAGDRPWRFPLWHYFHKQITNEPSVDLRNRGSGHATPCLGAAFLKNFICSDWVHMDITGVGKVAHSWAPPYLDTRRMTGRPTRTLAVMIQQIATNSLPPSEHDKQPCAPCPSSPEPEPCQQIMPSCPPPCPPPPSPPPCQPSPRPSCPPPCPPPPSPPPCQPSPRPSCPPPCPPPSPPPCQPSARPSCPPPPRPSACQLSTRASSPPPCPPPPSPPPCQSNPRPSCPQPSPPPCQSNPRPSCPQPSPPPCQSNPRPSCPQPSPPPCQSNPRPSCPPPCPRLRESCPPPCPPSPRPSCPPQPCPPPVPAQPCPKGQNQGGPCQPSPKPSCPPSPSPPPTPCPSNPSPPCKGSKSHQRFSLTSTNSRFTKHKCR
ncbi:hypothetical protein PYW08_002992 [Mythimna loreyi]|uniref:Uncharacterized protein n=1 Tax=Mythimna loreyi TaxID=667449 RepID=A0ACC2QQ45_9NEOP|nr:hypothetical protein PYW08_002992 [Mythimna loreyi]